MKANKTILAMLLAATFMTFAACGEKEEPEPEQPQVHYYDLSGTTWESQMSNTYSYMGMLDMNIDLFTSLDFINDTAGESYIDFSMEVPAQPTANQTQNYTEQFTYKFDGTILTLYTVEDTTRYVETYNYDRSTNTFWQEVPDEVVDGTPINIRDLYGSDRIVLQLVRGNFSL